MRRVNAPKPLGSHLIQQLREIGTVLGERIGDVLETGDPTEALELL